MKIAGAFHQTALAHALYAACDRWRGVYNTESCYGGEIQPGHHHTTSKGMSQVEKGKILQASLPDSPLKRCMKRMVWCPLPIAKNRTHWCCVYSNCLQRRGQHRVHWNTATLTILGVGCLHRDGLSAKVRVLPGQRQQLRGPESCMQRGYHQRREVWPTVRQQAGFCFRTQHPVCDHCFQVRNGPSSPDSRSPCPR